MKTSITQFVRIIFNNLPSFYEDDEKKTIAQHYLMDKLNLSLTQLKLHEIGNEEFEIKSFENELQLLREGSPLQYVTGIAYFLGKVFKVDNNVLIPRQETEELVNCILEEQKSGKIIDIGTGSGCIAITLKLNNNNYNVTAMDVSAAAINIAQHNAKELGSVINFMNTDLFSHDFENYFIGQQFNIVVSNPPYVLKSEAMQMRENVLIYEPEIALFVQDHNPFTYYERIIQLVNKSENTKYVYFEINESKSKALLQMLKESYKNLNAEIKKDLSGKDRMLLIRKI